MHLPIEMIKDNGDSLDNYAIERLYGVAAKKENVRLYEGTERECVRNRFIPKPSNEIILDENENVFS